MIDTHAIADIKCCDYEKNHIKTLGDDFKSTKKGTQHQFHTKPRNTMEPKELGDGMMNVVVQHTKSLKFDDKARSMSNDIISCDKESESNGVKNVSHKARLPNGSKTSDWQSMSANNLKDEVPRKRKLNDIDELSESSKRAFKDKGDTHNTRDSYDAPKNSATKIHEREYHTRTRSKHVESSKTAPKPRFGNCRREGVKAGAAERRRNCRKKDNIDRY